MSKTRTLDALLTEALQDLRAAELMLVARLPAIVGAARDQAFRKELEQLIIAAEARGKRLRATGRAEGGPANLWMAGVLDDADRDAGSDAAGVVRDVALVGAVRKGVAAALVSYETAMALAEGGLAAMLTGCRDEHRAHDAALARVLAALT